MPLWKSNGQVVDIEVQTTSGEKFTQEDTVTMAQLVFKRFGRDKLAAADAWLRMMQVTADPFAFHHDFYDLVQGVTTDKAPGSRER